MGMAIALNFQRTGNGRAAIPGDVVMLVAEVNPTIRILRERGIAVAAIHSHMLEEAQSLSRFRRCASCLDHRKRPAHNQQQAENANDRGTGRQIEARPFGGEQ
jgi:hypothetical protein